MKQFTGSTHSINAPVSGLVTRNPIALSRNNKILVAENPTLLARGFAGIITKEGTKKSSLPEVKVTGEVIEKLSVGDYVKIGADGTISVVWESKSPMNPLLLTELCDCHCIMCPQPPKAHDGKLTELSKQILNMVKVETDQVICLTGGEPTLLKEDLFDVLTLINKKHPTAAVMMLTNGKSFASFDFTKQFVSVRPKDFLTCVSLHSDVDELHDKIAGVNGSFYKTAMGLQNLARFRERIEIRVVVNQINATRLEEIAFFIQRNFPFVHHCAFMGMEITGFATDNFSRVWIDPHQYRDQLLRAVRALSRADIEVSIYNLPLCLLEIDTWSYAKKSISGWKNDYLPVCDGCPVKAKCCGIFTTSGIHHSPHIKHPSNY